MLTSDAVSAEGDRGPPRSHPPTASARAPPFPMMDQLAIQSRPDGRRVALSLRQNRSAPRDGFYARKAPTPNASRYATLRAPWYSWCPATRLPADDPRHGLHQVQGSRSTGRRRRAPALPRPILGGTVGRDHVVDGVGFHVFVEERERLTFIAQAAEFDEGHSSCSRSRNPRRRDAPQRHRAGARSNREPHQMVVARVEPGMASRYAR